ncbi:aquaporin-1-like protein [Lates japonicus]|uniref:Aquaporin-1-like protein n=1 Tax=Lates japonicus TaxID=270547 RepID=A0AAD3R0E5_LATJO|nr:aquaporin-1-like protein [Lates japonicus]
MPVAPEWEAVDGNYPSKLTQTDKTLVVLDSSQLLQLSGVTPSQGVGIELLATFQLVRVVCHCSVTDKRRRMSLAHTAGLLASLSAQTLDSYQLTGVASTPPLFRVQL